MRVSPSASSLSWPGSIAAKCWKPDLKRFDARPLAPRPSTHPPSTCTNPSSTTMAAQRRRHIAKIIHALLDGIGIQYVHESPTSADMRALELEIKAAVIALVEAD